MGACLGKQQFSLSNTPSTSASPSHTHQKLDNDNHDYKLMSSNIPFLSSKPLLLIEGFQRSCCHHKICQCNRDRLIQSISELILKYFICTRRTIYHIGGDPIESNGKIKYSSNIYNYSLNYNPNKYGQELQWLSDEITSNSTSPISNIFVMDSKFIVYFENGNIVCYDDNIEYNLDNFVKPNDNYNIDPNNLNFTDFNLKMIINNIHTICINSYQNGFKYDICCVDKINKNVLCFISSHIFEEDADEDEYYNSFQHNNNSNDALSKEYIENISLHNHLYIDKYYISLKEGGWSDDDDSDEEDSLFDDKESCDEDEEGQDINIAKVCLTDQFLYILTENGKLYHRGIFNINKDESNSTLQFRSHSSLDKDLFITDIVCNQFVIFIIDQYGDVYCKSNQILNHHKRGLLPDDMYSLNLDDDMFKIYKYFDETEIKIKQIALGLHHAIALDYDGYIYVWGDNKSKQLGFDSNKNNKKRRRTGTISLNNNKDDEDPNQCEVFEVPHRLSIIQQENGQIIVNHTKIIDDEDEHKEIPKKHKKRKRNIPLMKLVDNHSHYDINNNDHHHEEVSMDIDDGEELKFDSIVCGSNHSFVISLQNNVVFGWGSNENNQLSLYHDNNNNNNNQHKKSSLSNNLFHINNDENDMDKYDALLPTRMGIIEKLMKCNKQVDIFVVGDATYLNVQHY